MLNSKEIQTFFFVICCLLPFVLYLWFAIWANAEVISGEALSLNL